MRLTASVLAALSIAGCATAARDLPRDQSTLRPIDRVLSQPQGANELARTCQDICQEISSTTAAIVDIERQINDALPGNQVVGIISTALFFPAIIAANQQSDERQRYDALNARREWLVLVSTAKSCNE